MTSALTALFPGESERNVMLPDNFSILIAVTDFVLYASRRVMTQPAASLKKRRTILPLPGGEGRGEGGRKRSFH
jgi:hypothetical protein